MKSLWRWCSIAVLALGAVGCGSEPPPPDASKQEEVQVMMRYGPKGMKVLEEQRAREQQANGETAAEGQGE